MGADGRGLAILFFLLAILPFGCGCAGKANSMVVAGSTSVQPVMEKIVQAFHKKHPELRIAVEGGGSSAGIMAALTGAAQLGMSSRDLKQDNPDEAKLKTFRIALDAIAIIVNPGNPIEGLTLEQLRSLFTGKVRNWKEVGGKDRAVHVIIREEGSGTRGAFDEMVLKVGKETFRPDPYALVQDSSGGVREVVRGDPDSIAFISLGVANRAVKVVGIDGVKPSAGTVRDKSYRLVRPFLLVSPSEPQGLARQILDFTHSPEASQIMSQEGLVGVQP